MRFIRTHGVVDVAVVAAILRAGMVGVTMNPLYTARELQYQLSDSGAAALLSPKRLDLPVFAVLESAIRNADNGLPPSVSASPAFNA